MKKIIIFLLLMGLNKSLLAQVTESKYWTVRKNVTKVEAPSILNVPYPGVSPVEILEATFRFFTGKIHYLSDNEHYMFVSGYSSHLGLVTPPNSINDISPTPSLTLKRENGFWKFNREVPEVKTWMIRNFKIKDDFIVIGDGNEIGPNVKGNRWRGNAYLGKIGSRGMIDWVKVNDEKNMAYFHGITMGDLNGDGLIDIGGSPAGWENPFALKIFIQSKKNSFTNLDSIVIYNKEYFPPFTLEYVDLNNDGIDEIITADYGHPGENKMNHVMVYSWNKSTGKFENTFVSKTPTAFYNVRMGATSIHPFDFTNDGVTDLAIAREGRFGDGPGGAAHSFEIWRGLGDGTFAPHWSTPIWSANEIQFREFSVFDVNDDSYLDIIFRPFHYGSFYRNNPVWWNVPANNGIKLNKLIWLNDGTGKFKHYDKDELKIEGININTVTPYMDGKNLHFVGTFTEPNSIQWGQKAINLTTYDIQVHLNGIDAPNKPDLIFPEKNYSGIAGGTEFKWTATSNTKKYEIQFSSNASFNPLYLKTDTLTQNTFKIPAFKPGDPVGFYWRVRGIGVGGNGEWSPANNFTRAALTHNEDVSSPITFELHQNFPNPFNPSTQIQFSLPSSSHVTIEIFNTIGQRVHVLLDEMKTQGSHSITFDARGLTSGMYLYRLTTPEFTQTRMMSLVK
jgi:hypothetical protein